MKLSLGVSKIVSYLPKQYLYQTAFSGYHIYPLFLKKIMDWWIEKNVGKAHDAYYESKMHE